MKNIMGLLIILLCISSTTAEYPDVTLTEGDFWEYSDETETLVGFNNTYDVNGKEVEVSLTSIENYDQGSIHYTHNEEGVFMGMYFFEQGEWDYGYSTSIFEDYSMEELIEVDKQLSITGKFYIDKARTTDDGNLTREYGFWELSFVVTYIEGFTFGYNNTQYDGSTIRYDIIWSSIAGYVTYIYDNQNTTWIADGDGFYYKYVDGVMNETETIDYPIAENYNDSILIDFIPAIRRPSGIGYFDRSIESSKYAIDNPFRDSFFPIYSRGKDFVKRYLFHFYITKPGDDSEVAFLNHRLSILPLIAFVMIPIFRKNRKYRLVKNI